MSISETARQVNFQGIVLGVITPISITIENSFKATISFSMLGTPYSFVVDRWARRGLKKFMEVFHSVISARDITRFGCMITRDDGGVEFYENMNDIVSTEENALVTFVPGTAAHLITMQQKLNIVEQGCRDILECLNIFGQVHKRSILEYSIWYREKYVSAESSYSEYITLQTCHCVVRSDFLAPNIEWTLVKFPDI